MTNTENTKPEDVDGSAALMGLPRLRPIRCNDHPAYDADYCPVCGTAQVIR